MKTRNSTQTGAPAEEAPARKPYASPRLEQHGSVETLTQQTKGFPNATGGVPPIPSNDADSA